MVDTLRSFQEIVTYLERQYDDILAEQSRIKRNPRFRDNRVHVLLYFIPPTGHSYVCITFCSLHYPHIFSLREMDIELMRRLSPRVNVIPVIGRSDSLTPSELRAFRKRVRTIRTIVFFYVTRSYLGPSVDHGRYRTLRYCHIQFPVRRGGRRCGDYSGQH
jgi:septin family protein